MEGLNTEQQALFASIMGNSSQAQALNPVIPQETVSAPPPGSDPNRVLSQSEIDALIASLAGGKSTNSAIE